MYGGMNGSLISTNIFPCSLALKFSLTYNAPTDLLLSNFENLPGHTIYFLVCVPDKITRSDNNITL
jgi:hypothetical protein